MPVQVVKNKDVHWGHEIPHMGTSDLEQYRALERQQHACIADALGSGGPMAGSSSQPLLPPIFSPSKHTDIKSNNE